jgi:hypothetical protein
LIIASTSEASFTLGYASHFGMWLGIMFAENSGRIRFIAEDSILYQDIAESL